MSSDPLRPDRYHGQKDSEAQPQGAWSRLARPTATLLLQDVPQMHAFAAQLAEAARPGDVLGLVGELGAGKTELTRGFARALGVSPEVPVTSPSFTLLSLVSGGRLDLAHFDAYFMHDLDDLERAGFHDLRQQGCVVVIEWAERVAELLPDDTLWLQLEHAEHPGTRRLSVLPGPPQRGGDR